MAHARIFDDGSSVACAVRNQVEIYDISINDKWSSDITINDKPSNDFSTRKPRLVLSGPHVAAISCVEIVYKSSDKSREDGNKKKEVTK